jgi:hypothetical protein
MQIYASGSPTKPRLVWKPQMIPVLAQFTNCFFLFYILLYILSSFVQDFHDFGMIFLVFINEN